jgi:hypothetical protein
MNHLDIYSTSYRKKKGGESISSLTPDHEKSGIDLIPVCAGGV